MEKSIDPSNERRNNRIKLASAFASGIGLTLLTLASVRRFTRIDPTEEIWAIAANLARKCEPGNPVLFHIDHDNIHYYLTRSSRYPG